MGWFEWGSGNGKNTGNGGVFDGNNQVGHIDRSSNTVYDNSGNAVGSINSDNTVTWSDSSVSIWNNSED